MKNYSSKSNFISIYNISYIYYFYLFLLIIGILFLVECCIFKDLFKAQIVSLIRARITLRLRYSKQFNNILKINILIKVSSFVERIIGALIQVVSGFLKDAKEHLG